MPRDRSHPQVGNRGSHRPASGNHLMASSETRLRGWGGRPAKEGRHGARIRSCSDPDSQTAVPVLPSWIIEPLWDQFAALLPERVDRHPLGRHNQRIADQTCSARTLRRRRDEWVAAGVGDALRRLALAAYDWMLRVGPWTVGIDWGKRWSAWGGPPSTRTEEARGSIPLTATMPDDQRNRRSTGSTLPASLHSGAECLPSRPSGPWQRHAEGSASGTAVKLR